MEASAPLAAHIEPEPREWQLRALWVGARMLCGAAAFFFMAFLFAYFYLRSLDVNKSWKIGTVNPPTGFGVAIVVVLVASAVLLRMASRRPTEALPLGLTALGLALLSIVLQVIAWTTLGFGPGERRLRERVRRLDRVVRGVHAGLRLLDRDPDREHLAPRSRGRQASARARACPPTTSSCSAPGSRRARSSGRSTWCSA